MAGCSNDGHAQSIVIVPPSSMVAASVVWLVRRHGIVGGRRGQSRKCQVTGRRGKKSPWSFVFEPITSVSSAGAAAMPPGARLPAS